jgi:hypothetical protein
VLYTKTDPRRIYRVPEHARHARQAPYFTPARFPTMQVALHRVLEVVRRNTPKPLQSEVLAVSEYTNLLATRPSPFFEPDGEMPARVGDGDPRAGVAVFRAYACVECHPPPVFTVDQDEATRGKLFDVGTPEAIALRPELQTARSDPEAAGVARRRRRRVPIAPERLGRVLGRRARTRRRDRSRAARARPRARTRARG